MYICIISIYYYYMLYIIISILLAYIIFEVMLEVDAKNWKWKSYEENMISKLRISAEF